jgi:acetyltransferase-like isoleucine patch superfamily enzyme
VGHDSHCGSYSRLNPQACISGEVAIGTEVFFGANATALPRINIGDGVVVGAGAVVVDDVPDGMTVKGVPAR